MHVIVKETLIKQEDTTKEDLLSDTVQNITSTTELMDQDPLEVVGAPVKQEKIEDDEQINVKEEPEDDHCNLEADFVTI